MKKTLPRLVFALAFAAFAAGGGCSNDSGGEGAGASGSAGKGGASGSSGSMGKGGMPGTGGSSGTGGSAGSFTGSAGALNCTSTTACGGNVVGAWTVASSCLKLAGDTDFRVGLACPTVPVNGALQTTGTFVARADGTYTDNTTTLGAVTFPLATACLTVSSVSTECGKIGNLFRSVGWTTSACAETDGMCNCSLSAEQSAGLGAIVPYTEPTGRYSSSGDTLTVENVTYSYCVSGDTLTLTPQMSGLTGTVVMTRDSASGGAGGMSGGGMSGGGMSGGAAAGAGAGGAGAGGASAGGAGAGGAGAGSGGAAGSGGSAGTGAGTRPCDIYAAGDTPCVAAHSTIRALFAAYSGSLYQVTRASDRTTRDVPLKSPGGYADSAQQESFCMGTTCTITRVYDQSGRGNFIEAEIPGSTVGGAQGQSAANAAAESLNVGGNKVYSLYTRPNQAYWRDGSESGMPVGDEPQGIYMVTSGTHFNGGCCYNYGNAQLSRRYEGGPTMDAIYFGSCSLWGTGAGSGPWIMADMEDGMLSGPNSGHNPELPSMPHQYVTAVEKNNGRSEYALRGGNATTGDLSTFYKGALPGGKVPMKKQGAIVLGSGGDCCLMNNNQSEGTFYEGAIVAGYPSDATEDAIQDNIVAAGYGK
jgi:hypothetical protein